MAIGNSRNVTGKLKIEVRANSSVTDLEKSVNRFLEGEDTKFIVESIQYAATYGNFQYHSVLIAYREILAPVEKTDAIE